MKTPSSNISYKRIVVFSKDDFFFSFLIDKSEVDDFVFLSIASRKGGNVYISIDIGFL